MSQTHEPFPWLSTKSGRAYTGRRYAEASSSVCEVTGFVRVEDGGWVGEVYADEGELGIDGTGFGSAYHLASDKYGSQLGLLGVHTSLATPDLYRTPTLDLVHV